MSIYDRFILPRIIDLAMRNRDVTRYRAELVPQAHGVVVEIGVGSGLNLPFYSEAVTELHAVDPSPELLRMAERNARSASFPVHFTARSAEALPFGDASADTVVTTFTLCSIPDAVQALREAKRVLRPGGRLLFAEHGLAPEPSVQRWQQRLNALWGKIAGGCNLNRDMRGLIEAGGFEIVDLRNEYARGPKPMTYIYFGEAQLPA